MNKIWPNPIVNNVKISLVQDRDCCDATVNNEDYQKLEITWEDGGGGIFPIIKTDRFAFDFNEQSTKDLFQLINDINKLVTNHNSKYDVDNKE